MHHTTKTRHAGQEAMKCLCRTKFKYCYSWSKKRAILVRTDESRRTWVKWEKHSIFGWACILLSCILIGWLLYPWILICSTVSCGTLAFAPLFSLSWPLSRLLSLLLWCFLPLPSTTPPSSSSRPLISSSLFPPISVKLCLRFSSSQAPLSILLARVLR